MEVVKFSLLIMCYQGGFQKNAMECIHDDKLAAELRGAKSLSAQDY